MITVNSKEAKSEAYEIVCRIELQNGIRKLVSELLLCRVSDYSVGFRWFYFLCVCVGLNGSQIILHIFVLVSFIPLLNSVDH